MQSTGEVAVKQREVVLQDFFSLPADNGFIRKINITHPIPKEVIRHPDQFPEARVAIDREEKLGLKFRLAIRRISAKTGLAEIDLLIGAGGRIHEVIEGIAPDGWCNSACSLGPLFGPDRIRGNGFKIVDLGFFPLVLHTNIHIIQGKAPQGFKPQLVNGVEEPYPAARPAAVKILKRKAPVKDFHPKGQMGIQEIGVSPTNGRVPIPAAHIAADHKLMAIPKEIRFLNTGRANETGRGIKSGPNTESSGLGLFDIDQYIEQIAPRPPACRNIHILEKPESLHPGTAVLYAGGVELALLGNA